MDVNTNSRIGWECFKCNRIYSPTVIMCIICGPKNEKQSISSTGSNFVTTTTADKLESDSFDKNELPFDKRDQLYLRKLLFD